MKHHTKSALALIPGRFLVVASSTVAATIMLCEVAHAQNLVTPAVRSFSSELAALARLADDAVNGTGMSGPGSATDTHDNNSASMWMSGGVYVGGDRNPFITLDLGVPYDLLTTRIWTWNEPGFTQVGPKTIVISTSSDDVTYVPISTNTPTQGLGLSSEPAQDFSTPRNGVRFVKIQILENWDGAVYWNGGIGPDGTDTRHLTGLSEVRFEVSNPVVLTPLITLQPKSLTNYVGSTVTLTVAARDNEAPPLSYQWRKFGTNLSDVGNISGSTTTNLTISNITTNDAGNYNVVVSNPNGPSTSDAATLTVLLSPLSNASINLHAGIAFQGIAGFHYRVEYRNALDPTNIWQTLQELPTLPAAPSPFTVYDPAPATLPQRSYRVVYVP